MFYVRLGEHQKNTQEEPLANPLKKLINFEDYPQGWCRPWKGEMQNSYGNGSKYI